MTAAFIENETDDEEQEGGSRRMDGEIRTIALIIREVEKHDDSRARARIINYVHDRFQGVARG